MNLERRYRRFRIDPDGLMALLRGEAPAVERPLPPDASWVTMGFDHNFQMLIIVACSSTFDPVSLDREVPFSLNGPILTEAP